MIFASILLILVAVVLLVAGLAGGASPLLIASIAASLLAAVALVAGARQAAANRATGGRTRGLRTGAEPAGTPYGPRLAEPEIPLQHIPPTVETGGPEWRQPPGPPVTDPSEPPAQPLSPADVDRLAELDDAVHVVDGHPRFHLPDCAHLAGQDDEALAVAEAVELGFTPCAHCAPATVLLADAQSG